MTEKKIAAGVEIICLRAGITVPLSGPLDGLGLAKHIVLDRGDEALVTTAWVEEHADSTAFIRADDPSAPDLRRTIHEEQAAQRQASYALRMQQARTADERAELRVQERLTLAAEARQRQESTTTGQVAA